MCLVNYPYLVFSLQHPLAFPTIFSVVGSLGLFKMLSRLTSWFPANLAAAGPPEEERTQMLRITCIEVNLLHILNWQGSLVDDMTSLSKGLFHDGICTATRCSNSSFHLLFTTLRVTLQRLTCILRLVSHSAVNGESCMPFFCFCFCFFCMTR